MVSLFWKIWGSHCGGYGRSFFWDITLSIALKFDQHFGAKNYIFIRLRVSWQWLWRMTSSGMLRCVAFVRTDILEDRRACIVRVTIGELGTTLAVTSNWRTLQRNTKLWLTLLNLCFTVYQKPYLHTATGHSNIVFYTYYSSSLLVRLCIVCSFRFPSQVYILPCRQWFPSFFCVITPLIPWTYLHCPLPYPVKSILCNSSLHNPLRKIWQDTKFLTTSVVL
jgi:hypothetical protein